MKKNNSNKHKIFYCYTLIAIIIFLSPILSCGSASLNSTSNILVDIYVGASNGYWKNGEWQEFSRNKFDFKASTFLVSGKDIYAGGTIITSHYEAGYEKACLLKNDKKVPLTYLCNYVHSHKLTCDSDVYSIAIYGNDIYAGGYNMTCSGLSKAGYWKNSKWIGLKPVNSKENSSVYSIAVYNGNVYAVGSCYINSEISISGYWKNGEWIRLYPPDDSAKRIGTGDIVIHNDDIYIIGYCVYNSEIRIPGYWKNGECVKLDSIDNNRKLATSIFVDGDDIYVGGFSGSGFTKMIAGYWKNGKWVELKIPYPEGSSSVSSIVVHNGNIYAAGMYDYKTSHQIPCYWKNGELVTLQYDAGRDAYVTSIIVVDKVQD